MKTPAIAAEKAKQLIAEAHLSGVDPMAAKRQKIARAKA